MADLRILRELFGNTPTDATALRHTFLAVGDYLRTAAGEALKSGDTLGAFRALTYSALIDREGPALQGFWEIVQQFQGQDLQQLLSLAEIWLDPRYATADSINLTAKILSKLGLGASAEYLSTGTTSQSAHAQLPKVIMYGLECGGSSAIHPIVEEILTSQFGYDSFWGPAQTELYRPFQNLPVPTLHWTHHGIDEFSTLVQRPEVKFLCLIRDPRDALISELKINLAEFQKRMPGASESEILVHNMKELRPRLVRAQQWRALRQSNVLQYTFEQLKTNVPHMAKRIFEFLELQVDQQLVDQVCEKHAFENVTKRARGDLGQIVGQGAHMYRKGIAGGWTKEMDPEAIRFFADSFGDVLRAWGYPLFPEVQGPLALL